MNNSTQPHDPLASAIEFHHRRADAIHRDAPESLPVPRLKQHMGLIGHVIPDGFTPYASIVDFVPTFEVWSDRCLTPLDVFAVFQRNGFAPTLGGVAYTGAQDDTNYYLLHRNGAIEFGYRAGGNRLRTEQAPRVQGTSLEHVLRERVAKIWQVFQQLHSETAATLHVSLINVKGYTLYADGVDADESFDINRPREFDQIHLPPVQLAGTTVDVATVVRPVVNALYNAFGFLKSPNYKLGEFVGRR